METFSFEIEKLHISKLFRSKIDLCDFEKIVLFFFVALNDKIIIQLIADRNYSSRRIGFS